MAHDLTISVVNDNGRARVRIEGASAISMWGSWPKPTDLLPCEVRGLVEELRAAADKAQKLNAPPTKAFYR